MDTSRLSSICELQCEILTRAIELVKLGGDVVYSTCSMSSKQNEDVVRQVMSTINRNAQLEFRVDLVEVLGDSGQEGLLGSFGLCDSSLKGAKRIQPGTKSASAMFMAKLRKLEKRDSADAQTN